MFLLFLKLINLRVFFKNIFLRPVKFIKSLCGVKLWLLSQMASTLKNGPLPSSIFHRECRHSRELRLSENHYKHAVNESKLLLELVLDFSIFFLDLWKTAVSNFVPITLFYRFLLNQDNLENTPGYFCNSFSTSKWVRHGSVSMSIPKYPPLKLETL